MTDFRLDDWTNTLTSLGSVRDKATGVNFSRRKRLGREELEAMYEQNPIVARVVDRLPEDAIRRGWRLEGLDADIDMGALHSKLNDLGVDQALLNAAKWSRLYGGALLCLPVADCASPDKPLNLCNVESVYTPVVIPSNDAIPVDMDATFGSPTYRKVLSYDIMGLDGQTTRIHHSRCIPFEPIQLPYEALLKSPTGWGPSVVDRLYDALSKEGAARAHSISMMYVQSLMYVQMEGFRAAHNTAAGREQLKTLLLKMRNGMDSLGIMGIDKEDEIGNVTLSLAGVTDVIDRARDALAASADMPKEILFNESPAGLNAGQLSGPQELWFAHVESYQNDVLSPALDRILEVCFAWWGMPVTQWKVVWNPLWTKSDAASAQMSLAQAQGDQVYFEMGAVTAEEIRKYRLELGKTGTLELGPREAPVAETEPVVDMTESLGAPEQAAYDPPDGETPMSAGELAGVTGFSANSIRNMHKRGEIGGWRIGGRWRYCKSEVLSSAHVPAGQQKPLDLRNI